MGDFSEIVEGIGKPYVLIPTLVGLAILVVIITIELLI